MTSADLTKPARRAHMLSMGKRRAIAGVMVVLGSTLAPRSLHELWRQRQPIDWLGCEKMVFTRRWHQQRPSSAGNYGCYSGNERASCQAHAWLYANRIRNLLHECSRLHHRSNEAGTAKVAGQQRIRR